MEIKNNLLNKSKDDELIEIKLSEDKVTPTIEIVKTDSNYNVYIFLKGLVKKQIKIKYINNFFTIKMNLKNPDTNIQKEVKRSLYLKNLDMDNIKIISLNNVISLKIPITN